MAPTQVSVIAIDATHATGRPDVLSRRSKIVPHKPMNPAQNEKRAQTTRTVLDRWSVATSGVNWYMKGAHAIVITDPMASATLTQRGVTLTRVLQRVCW